MNGVPHWVDGGFLSISSEFTSLDDPGDTVCNKHLSLNNNQTHK